MVLLAVVEFWNGALPVGPGRPRVGLTFELVLEMKPDGLEVEVEIEAEELVRVDAASTSMRDDVDVWFEEVSAVDDEMLADRVVETLADRVDKLTVELSYGEAVVAVSEEGDDVTVEMSDAKTVLVAFELGTDPPSELKEGAKLDAEPEFGADVVLFENGAFTSVAELDGGAETPAEVDVKLAGTLVGPSMSPEDVVALAALLAETLPETPEVDIVPLEIEVEVV